MTEAILSKKENRQNLNKSEKFQSANPVKFLRYKKNTDTLTRKFLIIKLNETNTS